MAITFPAGAAGAEYTNPTTGVKYYWDTTDEVWKTHVWPTNTNYLQLSGGTLTGDLSLGTNDLTAQDITTTGAVSVGTGLTVGNGLIVSDGNVVMAAGHGIDFSATANGSGTTTSELLDDYEEGTWTPVFESQNGSFSSITYDAFVYGYYQKVGEVVHIHGFIRTDAITVGTASGHLYLGGLPFSNHTGGGENQCLYVANSAAWLGDHPTFGLTTSSDRYSLYYKTAINADTSILQVSDMNNSVNDNQMYFSGFFRAA